MANIKSQIKRNRQNDKRRLTNRVYRGEARIAVKNARTAMDDSAPETKEELKKAISALDKAAEKGVIHKNNAARRKSRLMRAFTAMKPAEVKTPVEEPKPEVEVKEEPKPRRGARTKTVKTTETAVEEKAKTKTTTKAATSKTTTKAKPKTTTTKKATAK